MTTMAQATLLPHPGNQVFRRKTSRTGILASARPGLRRSVRHSEVSSQLEATPLAVLAAACAESTPDQESARPFFLENLSWLPQAAAAAAAVDEEEEDEDADADDEDDELDDDDEEDLEDEDEEDDDLDEDDEEDDALIDDEDDKDVDEEEEEE